MFLGIVNSLNIIDINETASIFIKFVVCLGNNLLSEWVHWSSEDSNEFVIVDSAASINIEVLEKSFNFSIGETEHIILQCLSEFIDI